MKKCTRQQADTDTIVTAPDFSEEYSQYKEVFNGGLDRTTLPVFNKSQVKDGAFHKLVYFTKLENDYLKDPAVAADTTNFRCQTFDKYRGTEYLATSQTVTDIKAGWVHIEVSAMHYNSPRHTFWSGDGEKSFYVRLLWNGELVAEAGPITKTMYSYRICTGTYTTDGTGTLSVYIRAEGPKDADDVGATPVFPIYHWWNMQGLIIARWR